MEDVRWRESDGALSSFGDARVVAGGTEVDGAPEAFQFNRIY